MRVTDTSPFINHTVLEVMIYSLKFFYDISENNKLKNVLTRQSVVDEADHLVKVRIICRAVDFSALQRYSNGSWPVSRNQNI